jgi:peptidoglycan hydrolase CwlO-like protein
MAGQTQLNKSGEFIMKTIISGLVGLVIGAGATYFYQQGPMTELMSRATALEAQVTESKTMADEASAEVTGLQGKIAELTALADEKTKMAADLQAKIAEIEAELATAKAAQ